MAADYPAHLVHEHRLRGGRTVTIRPIRASDAPEEREFLDHLSPESWYRRFHKFVAAPSDKLVHFFTDIDYERHMAFVCVTREGGTEKLVGEARYVANPDGRSCDFGIVIADDWRRSGIAGLLMDALIRAARERGFERMEGLVLANNVAMLRFARALGFEVRPMSDDPATQLIVKRLRDDGVP